MRWLAFPRRHTHTRGGRTASGRLSHHIPAIEGLEDRTVPSILFSSNGTRVPRDLGGPVINSAHVELVFWGTGWNSGGGPALRTNVTNSANSIVSGPYLTLLSQYRSSIGSGSLNGSVTITSSSPGSTFSDSQVQSMLQTNITNGTLPAPSSDSQLLYMVITQPGSSAGNIGGEHNSAVNSGTRFHYGWTINNNSLDTITNIFSHELAEAVSDPEVNVRTAIIVPSTNDELCDGAAQNFSYRLNGVVVQSILSQRDHAYVVATGQTQNFIVSSSHALTVNGDQLANHDDTITLDLIGGGVAVTLNGETAQFGSNYITSITVNGGTGNDTINIERTSRTAPVTINLGNGSDTVNVSPTAQNLDNIAGNVALVGRTGTYSLVVNDEASAAVRTYTLSASNLTRTNAGTITFSGASLNDVTINGGAAADTFQVNDTPAVNGTTFNAGNGGNNILVRGATNPLVINTGIGDTVTLSGSGNTLDPIGSVSVNDANGTSAVLVDDSGFGSAEEYFLTNANLSISRSSGFSLSYAGLGSLTLNGGQGGDTFDLDSTSTTTTVNGGSSMNCFHISPFTQYLAGSIGGALTLNGSGADVLDFWDTNDPNAEGFNFDSTPSTLTLDSTGTTIAAFSGMGGGIYVMTNGFSSANDLSGTVNFDPVGGPPCVSSGGDPGPSPVPAPGMQNLPPAPGNGFNSVPWTEALNGIRVQPVAPASLEWLVDQVFALLP